MSKQPEALRLADCLTRGDGGYSRQAAAELRRLAHNNTVLMNALYKACGYDEKTMKEIIESQGKLK